MEGTRKRRSIDWVTPFQTLMSKNTNMVELSGKRENHIAENMTENALTDTQFRNSPIEIKGEVKQCQQITQENYK